MDRSTASPARLRTSRVGRWGWVAAGLVLTGCAQQVACTDIGCASQVVVDVTSLSSTLGSKPFQATLCVDGTCQMQAGTLSGNAPMITVVTQLGVNGGPTFAVDSAVPVTLTVVTRDGKTVTDAQGTITLHKVTPNGESCGPVCYQAALALSGTHLVETR
jgi:hypothetical protein